MTNSELQIFFENIQSKILRLILWFNFVIAHLSSHHHTMHNVVSLQSEICASCKMRSLGPSGTPNFWRRSSLKYGNSIIPTPSASKSSAYFWKTNYTQNTIQSIKFIKTWLINVNKCLVLETLPHILIVWETNASVVDRHQRILLVF